jgi:hypothetical protein
MFGFLMQLVMAIMQVAGDRKLIVSELFQVLQVVTNELNVPPDIVAALIDDILALLDHYGIDPDDAVIDLTGGGSSTRERILSALNDAQALAS